MKRNLMKLCIVFLFAAIYYVNAWAQATAEMSGTVRDQSGAVLPGVEVTATQTDTGVVRSTITNETGNYVMVNLPLGPYRLQASLPGFRTFAQTGIVLQVSSSLVINPVLEVGQVSESVEVQANAAQVETRSQGVGQVIENAQILDLPLNGRQVTELILLTPTVVSGVGTQTGGFMLGQAFNQNTSVSVAGGGAIPWGGTNYQLDGANHVQPTNNQNLSVPFPDALQEFKVETGALSAESGTHGAGSVTMVTKAGTNSFHGDLFEFVRNYKFNARNPFARSRDSMKRNQFGGTIGGPIIKNKLFFFAGYQGTTIRQSPSDTVSFVPTPAMLAGDFTAITTPACNAGRQINLAAPFVNNRIDPAQFSPVITRLVNRADFPKSSDPCGRYIWGDPNIQNWHFPVARIDYQRSANHSIFGRYLAESQVHPSPYEETNNLLNVSAPAGDISGLTQAFVFGDTYTFGPNVVHAFRVWTSRVAVRNKPPEGVPTWKSLGANVQDYSTMLLTVVGGPAFGHFAGRASSMGANFGLSDAVNLLRGNHQLNMGITGQVAITNLNSSAPNAGGRPTFNGATTGLGMADFMLGNAGAFVQGTQQYLYGKQWYLGLYAGDTWKANPNLTINLGLRWEPYFPFQFMDGTAYNLSFDDLRKGVRTQQYVNAPPGFSYPGDPNFPGAKRTVMNTKWGNFSPRVGLAWNVTGDGRTSVRVGAGTSYDFVPAHVFYDVSAVPPFQNRLALQGVKIDNPWANYPGGNPYPPRTGRDATFAPYSPYQILPSNLRNPNIQQWDFSIQRQAGTEWLASANYLGSHTIHTWTVRAVNPAVYIPGSSCVLNGVTYSPCSSPANTDQRRRLSLENPAVGQNFGSLGEVDDGATASYHALILALQRRVSRGVSITANHTWSHCIAVNSFTTTGNLVGYSDPSNRDFDRGNCAVDRRHIFNLTAAAETPQFSNRTLQALAGGWKLAPLLKVQSGQFFSVGSSRDIALSGIAAAGTGAPGQRVSQVLPNVYGNKTVNNYLNPAAFAFPQTGTLGNMGWNTILGPSYWTLDAAMSKTFRLNENQKVEIRAEAFNLTNSFRANPVTSPTRIFESNTFGQITSALDPRIMQFALKYFF